MFDLGTGNLLHSTVIAGFEGGIYHRYKLSGNVRIRISNLGGISYVLSAIFFDSPENSAEFVAADTDTSGTWKGVYGSLGNSIATEVPNLPPDVSVNFTGASTVSWSTNTTDTAALQRPLTNGRVASAWSAPRQLNGIIDSGPDTRNLSLYFVDFDNQNRKQIVELIDTATGAALDNTELEQFRPGVWLTYTVRGDVSVRVTSLTGASAVISGVFFD